MQLIMYDVLGREVTTLVNSEFSAGNYSVTWDGKDYNGTRLGSGVYFYTLQIDDYRETKKAMLVQ